MRLRVAGSVVGTVLVAVVLTACQFVTPQQTARSYTPSDGVNGQVGDVVIRNVFLVTDDGTSATVIGALANEGDADQQVTLQYAGGGATRSVQVSVPAKGIVSLRPGADRVDATTGSSQQVVLDGIRAQRGGLFRVGFGDGSATPVDLRLPVLTNSLPDYRTLTPTPTESTPPRRTPRPSDEATPLPTESGATLSPTQPPAP